LNDKRSIFFRNFVIYIVNFTMGNNLKSKSESILHEWKRSDMKILLDDQFFFSNHEIKK